MELLQIKKILEEYRQQFEEAFKLVDGANKNLKLCSEKYSQLKTNIGEHLKELEKRERKGQLNVHEQSFLLPAISEVSMHCEARVGSTNIFDLSSSLYDGQDYLNHYLSQLGV
ncbi:hypothetical protein C2869_06540 [Saccharobesus litoralis]|uniref:Uncharacterized protein n=1 Tax=Saccharobesus litoralis TaxID=2172099 RepID=A0A2S0VPH5_9ALTE|nr:hypothetical protein [Saccharobesus litoralis]AWB66118.1 hypothetical protein C2869_06540 [Saccharobesus litoralis]